MRKIIQTWDLGEVRISLLGPSNQAGPKTGAIEVETLDDSFRVDVIHQTLYRWVSAIESERLHIKEIPYK